MNVRAKLEENAREKTMNVRAKLAWLESHIVHEDSTKEVQRQPPSSQQNVVRHTARVENYL